MPLYEYKCEKCGNKFERIERVTAPEVRKCPTCKGKAVRLPSSPAIQFKGSGWYVTDYAGKGSSAAASEKSSSESGESKTASSSKDGGSAKKETSAKESSGKSKGKKE
ncbi:MAG: zinc ribbon domain-containing protein [Candidatus Acidiferrales bacterium]